MLSIKPAEKVIVCEAVSSTSEGGLHITGEKDKPELGKVIAIGKGKPPLPLKVGDEIAFRKYTESVTMIRGKEYNFVLFKDLMAVIK